jgi:hypothetical protein
MRNATLQDLAARLQDEHNRKLDIVAPAASFRAKDGHIIVQGAEPELSTEGVTSADGTYLPTAVFDEGAAEKLGIPVAYLRKLRENHVDLYDANVNGWLERDARSFLLRCFTGEPGVARAMLSDGYKVIDNFDVLTAVLSGVKESGIKVDISKCDLTDRRMYVKVAAPGVAALAPKLLQNYRSPFTGKTGLENPTVFAGFRFSNSEVGNGAFTITPEITVEICDNGMTMTTDALRAVHLGGRLETGVVRWSGATHQKNLELVTSMTKDAVTTFLDTDYVTSTIAKLEEQAGIPVEDAAATIKRVSTKLAFSDETTKGILDFFIQGSDLTAGGVMQAVTAYCQTVEDADTAWEIQSQGVRAMELAAAR